MEEVKLKIKQQIQIQLKLLNRAIPEEEKLRIANTMCRLLDAYHKTERPYYKKRPYKNILCRICCKKIKDDKYITIKNHTYHEKCYKDTDSIKIDYKNTKFNKLVNKEE